eukprot:1146854-Pelagomonas_calceolata.AAC.1
MLKMMPEKQKPSSGLSQNCVAAATTQIRLSLLPCFIKKKNGSGYAVWVEGQPSVLAHILMCSITMPSSSRSASVLARAHARARAHTHTHTHCRPLPPSLELLARRTAGLVQQLTHLHTGAHSPQACRAYQPDAALVNYYYEGALVCITVCTRECLSSPAGKRELLCLRLW